MSARPEIPDGEKYRLPTDWSDECAHLIIDLLKRNCSMRVEGEGNNSIYSAYSAVYEPLVEPSHDKDLPSLRVREDLCEYIDQQQAEHSSSVGASVTSSAAATYTACRNFEAYTLDFGQAIDDEPEFISADFDEHDMYSWTPYVTAIIERKQDNEQDLDEDFVEIGDEVDLHLLYADNGQELSEVDIIKLSHLLQSVLYTDREHGCLEPSDISSPSMMQSLGRMITRPFGVYDAIEEPCIDCARSNIFCVHGGHTQQ